MSRNDSFHPDRSWYCSKSHGKVVSPFVEFKADDDIFCNDSSIIGFPFIIETWNEQPILLDLIDNYLGYFELNKINLRS